MDHSGKGTFFRNHLSVRLNFTSLHASSRIKSKNTAIFASEYSLPKLASKIARAFLNVSTDTGGESMRSNAFTPFCVTCSEGFFKLAITFLALVVRKMISCITVFPFKDFQIVVCGPKHKIEVCLPASVVLPPQKIRASDFL